MAHNVELSESADRELGKLDVQQTGKRPVCPHVFVPTFSTFSIDLQSLHELFPSGG